MTDRELLRLLKNHQWWIIDDEQFYDDIKGVSLEQLMRVQRQYTKSTLIKCLLALLVAGLLSMLWIWAF